MKALLQPSQHDCVSGLTLIELLITISILGTIAALASINFRDIQQSNRRDSYMLALHRHVTSARAYAIYHNEYVTICPSENNNCVADWNKPFLIYVDLDKDRQHDSNEPIIQLVSSPSGGDTISYPRKFLVFKPTGTVAGVTNGSFLYCSQNMSLNEPAVRISVSVIGRIRKRSDSYKCSR